MAFLGHDRELRIDPGSKFAAIPALLFILGAFSCLCCFKCDYDVLGNSCLYILQGSSSSIMLVTPILANIRLLPSSHSLLPLVSHLHHLISIIVFRRGPRQDKAVQYKAAAYPNWSDKRQPPRQKVLHVMPRLEEIYFLRPQIIAARSKTLISTSVRRSSCHPSPFSLRKSTKALIWIREEEDKLILKGFRHFQQLSRIQAISSTRQHNTA